MRVLQKQMNKFFVMILAAFFALPINVWAVDGAVQLEPIPAVDIVQESSQPEELLPKNRIDEDDVESSNSEVNQSYGSKDDTFSKIPYKQPVSKRKIVFKFLAAMGGVVLSSLIIFVLLSVYNRIRDGFSAPIKTPDGETSLETPNDIDGAVKTFLDKTDWKN